MNINERLALERTRLANWRTLLAYIRTGVSFIALGAAFSHLLDSIEWNILGALSIVAGIAFLVIGTVSYKRYEKRISRLDT